MRSIRFKSVLIGVTFLATMPLLKGQAQESQLLSRRSVVEMSLEHSYTAKNNRLESEKIRHDKQKAWETFLPNVSVNSSYTHLNDAISMSIPPVSLTIPGLPTLPAITLDPITLQKQDILKTDVSAQMVLFTGLKVAYGTQALNHQGKALDNMEKKIASDIIAETIQTYDRLAVIAQSDKVLEESSRRLDKEAEFAAKALQQGLITSYDQSKIEIARQELEAKRIELRTARNLTISKLSQLTGKPASTFETISPALENWAEENAASDYHQNPQLGALQEVIEATSYKKKSTLSGYLPVVYAFGKKELITEDLSALDPECAVGIGLKWNIFDGMQTYRERQKSQIDVTIAQNNYDAADELLALNLEKTRQELELANQLINVAQKKENTAAKGLEIARRQYETGLGGITERLAAETDYQNACLEHIQAIYRQRTATLALLDATGQLTMESIKD